ncbi:MAG TPA: amidohydrolase family protein [Thermoplasmata archaeon]|nr:amidohydrolase family protein [Thermoplasmata archaeon]
MHLHPTRYSPHGPLFAAKNGIDYSVEGLLAEMERNGIGYGVFLAPRLAPSPEAALEESAAVFRHSAGRLLPTVTVDPTLPEEEVRRVVQGWDSTQLPIAAVKLYPGYFPFSVADPRVRPVLAWAERHQTPVFVHGGDPSDPNGGLRFTRPVDLDEVAVQWRSVTFVLCHLGNPWMEEAAEVVGKNANVLADTSGLLNPFVRYGAALFRRMSERLRNAFLVVGDSAKFLYGSDWPISTLGEAIRLLRSVRLEPEDEARVFGGNARRLFGLPP